MLELKNNILKEIFKILNILTDLNKFINLVKWNN